MVQAVEVLMAAVCGECYFDAYGRMVALTELISNVVVVVLMAQSMSTVVGYGCCCKGEIYFSPACS